MVVRRRGDERQTDPRARKGVESEYLILIWEEVIDTKEEKPRGAIGRGKGMETREWQSGNQGIQILASGGDGQDRAKGKASQGEL